MPFQSEAQRRYLWANEPEIARDWADTYGSRIESNTGGITRLGFANSNKEYLDFKKWFDAQQKQGQEESIHDLYQQYQREKRDKEVYDQKHMAATGGIMRLGYAQGNPHQDQDPGLGMSPGEAQARGLSAIHHGSTTSGNLHAGNVGGEGGNNQAQGIGPVIDTGANILQGILPFMDPKKANMFGLGLSIYDIIRHKNNCS